ncbi:NADP oxidoreductase [Skermania sp. ID1734]|uniref:FAD-dependent oxidoreductase n=1 Tax=Skermania sp. ID1734 TaxID=2597516 RepID=UPI00118003E7|nr:FAD-dependent oxidoreductase [Skermania sp. ID1734]TSE01180.1 NADP oxidoreductase [Skermania sp. ID1734]
MTRPLRVAVIGAGPSGMYAAGHLLEGPGGTYLDGRLVQLVNRRIEVDVIDRLATQWGLVRNGVAPDHPDKKLAHTVFEHIAARDGFRFFGNIEIGTHVTVAELAQWYDAVIYAYGADRDAALRIPGESTPGSVAAREFIAWFNGHPGYAHLEPDLSHERAVIIGNGNVALDVARILTAPTDVLARTDIADHALQTLRHSRIREVVLLGRRGYEQAAFNNPELEELGHLRGVDIVVQGAEFQATHQPDPTTRRKVKTLRTYAQTRVNGHDKRIILRFLTSPVNVLGTDRATGLTVEHNEIVEGSVNPTGTYSVIETGLIVRAVGYFGSPIEGLPFDERRGVIANTHGRVEHLRGAYVTGWMKRGPRGIIGTNKKCARDTVRALLADADLNLLPTEGTLARETVEQELRHRQPNLVDQPGWRRIDAVERIAGWSTGRPRVKLTNLDRLLTAAAPVAEHASPVNRPATL